MHVSSALVKGPSIKHYNIYYVITGHVCGSFLFVSKICVNATVKVKLRELWMVWHLKLVA